jgi:ABC-type branched-subunit amino acid transport system substrate-binding protein
MEGQIFAKYLLKTKPDAKLGIFSQNDDAGKDYVRGLKSGLGDKAAQMIVKEVTYETSDPTVDSQIVALKASGADTLFTMATPKFGAQAIRKVAELGWSPLNFVVSVSSSITGVLEPAGLAASKGLLAVKSATDPRWQNAKDVQEFRELLKEWFPRGDAGDASNVIGYISAFMTVKVLEMCGNDLTRDNLMQQVIHLTKVQAPLLLPGITITTTPQRYSPYNQMQIARFDGTRWVPDGPVISTDDVGQ